MLGVTLAFLVIYLASGGGRSGNTSEVVPTVPSRDGASAGSSYSETSSYKRNEPITTGQAHQSFADETKPSSSSSSSSDTTTKITPTDTYENGEYVNKKKTNSGNRDSDNHNNNDGYGNIGKKNKSGNKSNNINSNANDVGEFTNNDNGDSNMAYDAPLPDTPPSYDATQYQSVEDTVAQVDVEIQATEESQLEQSETMLNASVNTLGSSIGELFAKFFRSNANVVQLKDSEVEALSKQVTEEIREEVLEELREKADESVEEEIATIDDTVEADTTIGYDADAIRHDIQTQRNKSQTKVREDISGAAVDLRANLRQRAAEKEKAILEEQLSKRLGKKVKIVLEDDHLAFQNNSSGTSNSNDYNGAAGAGLRGNSGGGGSRSYNGGSGSGGSLGVGSVKSGSSTGSGGSGYRTNIGGGQQQRPTQPQQPMQIALPSPNQYVGYSASPNVPQRQGGTNNSGMQWKGYGSDPVTPQRASSGDRGSDSRDNSSSDRAGSGSTDDDSTSSEDKDGGW